MIWGRTLAGICAGFTFRNDAGMGNIEPCWRNADRLSDGNGSHAGGRKPLLGDDRILHKLPSAKANGMSRRRSRRIGTGWRRKQIEMSSFCL